MDSSFFFELLAEAQRRQMAVIFVAHRVWIAGLAGTSLPLAGRIAEGLIAAETEFDDELNRLTIQGGWRTRPQIPPGLMLWATGGKP